MKKLFNNFIRITVIAVLCIAPTSVHAIYYNPGDTLDPACIPSPTCTVNVGYQIGTSTTLSSISGGIFFESGTDIVNQSGNLSFDDGTDVMTLGGSLTLGSTSTPAYTANTIYNDNGTLYWNGLALGSIGGSGTTTQVAFWNSSSIVTSTSSLVWNAATNMLGLNTTTPASVFDVVPKPLNGQYGVTIQSLGNSIPTFQYIGAADPMPRMRLFEDHFEINASGFGSNAFDFTDPIFVPKIRLNKTTSSFFHSYLVIGTTSSAYQGGFLTVASNGTALLPAIAVGNQLPADSDTGFFKPGPDIIGITTGGIERMRIGSTGNVSIGTTTMEVGNYDNLIVGGTAGNAGITIVNDINAALRIGRFTALIPNSYTILSPLANRFAWSSATDVDIMHLSNDGKLLIGYNLATSTDAFATLHASTTISWAGVTNTATSSLRIGSFAADVDFIIASSSPEGVILGIVGDISISTGVTGALYVKRPAASSLTGWAEVLNASTTCAVSGTTVCHLGNTLVANVIVGTNDAFNLQFETNNAVVARIDINGDFSLSNTTARYKIGADPVLYHNGITSNIFAGVGAGSTLVTGTNNTFVGNNAGTLTTTGQDNVAIGANAFMANTTGSSSIAIGSGALSSNISGSDNIAIGRNTLSLNTAGMRNIAIGYEALRDNTASDNIAIGWNALLTNTTGTSSIAIGKSALAANTIGDNNLAIGLSALTNNTSGTYNIAIGQNALDSNTTGTSSIAIGREALMSVTGASGNIAIGNFALRSNTTGTHNIAIGNNALDLNTTGSSSIAIGLDALTDATASNNIAFGYRAMASTTSGTQNIGVGYGALEANTTGVGNIALGHFALASSTESNTLAIGARALALNTTGIENLAMGAFALAGNTTGSGNFALGSSTLTANTTGSDNFMVGADAGRTATSSSDNFGVGHGSLLGGNSVSGNFGLGSGTLDANTFGVDNFAIGGNSQGSMTLGGQNFSIGVTSAGLGPMASATSSSNNFVIGANAMDSAITTINMTQNLGIGTDVFGSLTFTGTGNIALGRGVLIINTTGSYNVGITSGTLVTNTTGNYNLAIGSTALDTNIGGSANLGIGTNALTAESASIGNIGFGFGALDATTGSNNIGIGENALGTLTTGSNNIVIGHRAGTTTTAGSGNIIIGNDLRAVLAGNSNDINIGGVIFGSTTVSATPRIGIRNASPQVTLHVGSTTIADATALIRVEDANSTCDFTAQAGAPACGSDSRLKKNIETDSKGLAEILALRTVTYHWNKEGVLEEKHTGFIAQEVEAILPELVSEREDGIKLLAMSGMIPTIVGSLQQLHARLATFDGVTGGVSSDSLQSLIVSGALTLAGHATFDADTTGTAVIPAGETFVFVPFSRAYTKTPIITASALQYTESYFIGEKTEQGFTVSLARASEEVSRFSWHAFAPISEILVTTSGAPLLEDIYIGTSTPEAPPLEEEIIESPELTQVIEEVPVVEVEASPVEEQVVVDAIVPAPEQTP